MEVYIQYLVIAFTVLAVVNIVLGIMDLRLKAETILAIDNISEPRRILMTQEQAKLIAKIVREYDNEENSDKE